MFKRYLESKQDRAFLAIVRTLTIRWEVIRTFEDSVKSELQYTEQHEKNLKTLHCVGKEAL